MDRWVDRSRKEGMKKRNGQKQKLVEKEKSQENKDRKNGCKSKKKG